MSDCNWTQEQRKRILDMARRLGKGETVTATPAEREAAEGLIRCNREIWRTLKGGK